MDFWCSSQYLSGREAAKRQQRVLRATRPGEESWRLAETDSQPQLVAFVSAKPLIYLNKHYDISKERTVVPRQERLKVRMYAM